MMTTLVETFSDGLLNFKLLKLINFIGHSVARETVTNRNCLDKVHL
jgi:hypothetical protein